MNVECLSAYRSQININAHLSVLPWPSPIVFIVHGDLTVRQSLESTMIGAGWDVNTFESTDDFLAHPHFSGPSCLILDITSLEPNGHLQMGLAVGRSHMPILLVTRDGNLLLVTHMMKARTIDFPAAPFEGNRILDAIRTAISSSEMSLRHERNIETLRAREEALTGRERQVMTLVAAGLLNKQVGHELGISEITVKAHRGNVMRKMKARSAAELVKMAASLIEVTGGSDARLSG